LTALPSRILVPIIVACALFMENLDATVLATSLPAIARDMGEDPIALKLALTSYLLSLAVFIPASGWMADRFGAKRIFRLALAIFMLGSVFCGFAATLTDFVLARIVQGLGGAMMVPVGRLVILRSVPKSELVGALAWFTIPAIVGPIAGPPLGGFITTYFSWRWIFYINIPIGLLGIVLVTRYIEDIHEQNPPPLDVIGLVLLGTGLSGLVFGLAVLGQGLVPFWAALAMIAAGGLICWLYARHAVRTPHPLLDLSLMRIATFRASIIGGTLFRIGAGATTFLLPLLFQLGFGLTAFASGMLTFVAAIGAFLMKFTAPPILKRFGFRNVLVANALISSVFVCGLALFTAATPHTVIIGVLLIAGYFRSLQFSAVNTLIYADISPPLMSQVTSFASAATQLSLSFGVAVAALTLEAEQTLRGNNAILVSDFATAFLVVGVIGATSAVIFWHLPRDAGAELTGKVDVIAGSTDPASTAHPSRAASPAPARRCAGP
jgi:EmrB/QacA subfamily drug resistance transporter